jgi:hypothetical protein
VQTGLARVDGQTARHVSLQLFDGPRTKAPSRVFEWDIAINRPIGQCSYSGDGGTVRLAVGTELWEVSARGRRMMRTLTGATADVLGFCESPGGSAIVAACADGRLCQWETASGTLARTAPPTTRRSLRVR